MQLLAGPCISRLNLKDFHTVPVVFQVYAVAPCIFRLYLKGVHKAPVVFEVYKMAPCGFMHLHASLDLS